MENPIKMDDLGGTTIFGNIHVFLQKTKDFPVLLTNSDSQVWLKDADDLRWRKQPDPNVCLM